MADNSLFICSNCGKNHKVIPLANSPPIPSGNSNPGKLFKSISTSFVDDPPESITHIEPKTFWSNESVTYGLTGLFAGSVVLAYGWYYDVPNGMLVAGTMLSLIIGLPILKIWLHRTTAANPDKPRETTIKIESVSPDKENWLIAELPGITQVELTRVCNAIVDSGFVWKAAITTKHLSQGKHHKLKDKFTELNFIQPLPNGANGYSVTGSGRRFFRQVATLPH